MNFNSTFQFIWFIQFIYLCSLIVSVQFIIFWPKKTVKINQKHKLSLSWLGELEFDFQ